MIDLQAELDARRDQVVRLEQERADLQIEVEAFRQTYLARVGPAQAELDALELHIEAYRLRRELLRMRGNGLDAAKLEAEVEWQLRGRREQFAGYQASIHRAEATARTPSPVLDSTAQLELKLLYRDLAKRAHPDLALDEADRAARGALMAEINAAYARGDQAALQALAARLSGSGRENQAGGADWLRAEIERLDGVIIALRAEIGALNASDWLALKLDAALARSRGIDWFNQACSQIEARMVERRAELARLIAGFMELVREVGLG
ncbi:MAG TPA: J domain-containing protein [Anaerolineae bacterium]|nr:J domain-containing protein [Anaerolineae bacterium]